MAQTYSILGDSPVDAERDKLNFGAFVKPFAERLIQSVDNTPFTVGILADWGQGKSTVMRMLQHAVKAKPHECPTAWFEPWKYNGREAVWKGLALTLVAEIRKDKTLRSELRRKQDHLKTFAAKALWSRLIGREWAQDLVDTVKQEPWSPSLLHEFEENFETLFEHIHPEWQKKTSGSARPFVLFVDDLDRCLPEAALAVLEALKLVLNRPGLITVMGIAEGELSRAVTAAYARETKDVKEALDPEWGRKYMRKVIQMPFPLPVISDTSFEEYVGTCLSASGIEAGLEGDQRWRSIIRDACQSNLREVKRFLNHLISEMDKADANEGAGGRVQELDRRRVAFTLLLGWRFAGFLELIRRQVTDRDLLVRYQLFFAQKAAGQNPDPSLLQDPDARFHDDDALASFFDQCLGSAEGRPALVVPFATWLDVQPYLQFGARTGVLETATAASTAAPTATAVPVGPPASSTTPPRQQPPAAPPATTDDQGPAPAPPVDVTPAAAPAPDQPAVPMPSERVQQIATRIQALLSAGRWGDADREVEAGLKISKALADVPGEAVMWTCKGELDETRGNLQAARDAFDSSLTLTKAAGSPNEHVAILNLARLERQVGDLVKARDLAVEAEWKAHSRGDGITRLNAMMELAEVADRSGLPTDAEIAYSNALTEARVLQHKPGELILLERLVRFLRKHHRDNEDMVSRADALAASIGDRRARARLQIERGLIAMRPVAINNDTELARISWEYGRAALDFARDEAERKALLEYVRQLPPPYPAHFERSLTALE